MNICPSNNKATIIPTRVRPKDRNLIRSNTCVFFGLFISYNYSFSKLFLPGFLLIFLFIGKLTAAVPQLVIHWSSDTKVGSEVLLSKLDGSPISAGKGYNGDGCLVTLGYFDQANSGSPFNGNWIPLTNGTRVGDSSTGYGFNDGHFFVTSIFTKDSDTVEIYPTEPAFYETLAPHPITSTLPTPGTPICIRFYDSDEITINTKYNTVTGQGWVWPAFSSGVPENLYLKVSNNTPPFNTVWKYGYDFQHASHPTVASEPVNDELPNYLLNSSVVGNGTINDHNTSFKAGSVVELTAVPNDAQTEFLRWEGAGLLQTAFPTTYASILEDMNVTAYFQPKNYSISVSIEGTGDVSISGQDDGYNHYGDIIELNATTSFGHVFSHWLGVGPDSNASSTTLTVGQDHVLTAVFVPQTLDLNLTTNNDSFGSAIVESESPFKYASRYSISASPNFGFSFSHWSSSNNSTYMLDDANLSSTGLTLHENAHFQANFIELFYQLDISMGNGGQSVSPASGLYSAANTIQLNAVPAMGYDFYKWNDPYGVLTDPYIAQSDANLSMISGNVFLTATFRKKNYQVSIIEDTGGNVIFDTPNGPWEYLGKYELDAIAQPGYEFSDWSGGSDSVNSLKNGVLDSNNSLSITSDVNLTANFDMIQYSIEVTTTAGGQVTGGGDFNISSPPTLSAIPGTGWQFSHWEGNETHLSQLVSQSSSTTLVNLGNAPRSLSFEAHFIKDAYELTGQTIGEGTINGNSSLSLQFENGSEISLIASPSPGWKFERWYDTELPDPYLSVLVLNPTSDTSISALFIKNEYRVTLGSAANGSSTGAGIYPYESEIDLSASPLPGYQFSNWVGDVENLQSQTLAQTKLTLPDRNVSITPVFSPLQVNLSTFSIGNGSVSAGGTFNFGDQITLQATPDSGNIFEEWEISFSDGNVSHSSTNPVVIEASQDLSITAKFIETPENQVSYSLVASPLNSGILYDDSAHRIWDPIEEVYDRRLHATANPGYSFLGWSSTPGLAFSPSPGSTVTEARPTEGSVVTANFAGQAFKLEAVYSSDRGQVSGQDNNFSYLTEATLVADPDDAFEFDYWKIDKSINYLVRLAPSSVSSLENKIFVDEKESPQLTLIRGFTYAFEVSLEEDDSFFLSSSAQNDDTYVDEWTGGVLNSRSTNGILIFQVPMDAPSKLYYNSSKYAYSGNEIKIITRSDSAILPLPNEAILKSQMDTDLSFEAVFKEKQYNLSISTTSGGAVNFSEGLFPHGSTVSLTATPNEHFQFVRWEGNAQIDGSVNPSTSIQLLSNENARAIFTPILYPLTVSTSPANAGLIQTAGNLFEFPHGTEVQISVTPSAQYVFAHWFGNVADPNSKTTTIVINSATEVTAHLSQAPLVITSSQSSLSPSNVSLSNPQVGGTITIPTIANVGKPFPVNATSNDGYEFIGWFDQNNQLLSSATSTYLTFYENATVTGKFKQKSYEVIVTIKNVNTGKVSWEDEASTSSISKSVAHGTTVSMSAIPEVQHLFSRWTITSTGFKTSDQANLSLEVTSDLSIEAAFKEIIPILTILPYPNGSGIIPAGNGQKSQGNSHIIMAQPLSGYEFDRWIGQGVTSPENSTTTISFNSDQTIFAQFRKIDELIPNLPTVDEKSATTGQKTTNWLGTVWHNLNSDLQYHEVIGWIHLQLESDSSVWIWIPSLGKWYWTEENSFPSLYDDASQTWVQLDLENSSPENLIILSPNGQGFEENPLVPGSILQTGRWWLSPWFDPYWHLKDSKWAYHQHLGWMYVHTAGLNSIWTWIEILGEWHWTNSSSYPYFYSENSGDWLWFDRENSSNNHRMFYRFGLTSGWQSIR